MFREPSGAQKLKPKLSEKLKKHYVPQSNKNIKKLLIMEMTRNKVTLDLIITVTLFKATLIPKLPKNTVLVIMLIITIFVKFMLVIHA